MPQRHLRGTLIATILGSSLAFIDSSVVNIILPSIQAEFHQDLAHVQWVIHSYGLFLSTFLLLGGALGDHFGRKRLFQIGLLLFLAASIGAAVAPSLAVLLFARAVQGLGAAIMTPESLSIIEATFPQESRPRAIAIWSSVSAITAAIGPPLGGVLTDAFGWRSVFLLNLPIGAVAWIAARRSVPESCAETFSAKLDYRGTFVSTLGVGGVILALTQRMAIPGFIGLALLGIFLAIEHWSSNPLLPLSVFRSREFSLCNALTAFVYAPLSGTFYFLPLHWIKVDGFSAAKAGTAILPMILCTFALSPVAGSVLPKLGARAMLTAGAVVSAAGYFVLSGAAYLPGLLLLGVGMATLITPLTVTVLGSLGEARAGLASGFNNAVARTAGLIGVACTSLQISGTGSEAGRRIFLANAACCLLAAALGWALKSRAGMGVARSAA